MTFYDDVITMFVGKYTDMPKVDMTPAGAKNAIKQVVVGPEQGWEDYVLRVITLDVDGYSPTHTHDWPHINYLISGKGIVMIGGKEYPVEPGTCAYVPSNEEHCFVNKGDVPMELICIVPLRGEA